MLSNAEIIKKLRNWDADYVARNNERIKRTGEVFTPTALVQEMLAKIDLEKFKNSKETFLDYCCGNGQFLSEVLIKKLEYGSTFKQALSTIFGVDIMLDNVEICRERLLCGVEEYRYIVERNIAWGDALTFNFDTFSVEL